MKQGIARSVDIFAAGAQKFFYLQVKPSMTRLFLKYRSPRCNKIQGIQFYRAIIHSFRTHYVQQQMGADPKKSVVQNNHLVWGTQNLYVVDSSICQPPRANPKLSIASHIWRLKIC